MSKRALEQPLLERASKRINLSDMYPLIREVLSNGGTFTLTITGTSMYPFIVGGRDNVTLSPVPERLRKNDLPLYRRRDGSFVLHRIIKLERDGTYTCCGDHQSQPEKGLRHEQMVALATAYVRKGKSLTNRNFLYRVYRTLWTWLLRYRWIFFTIEDKRRKLLSHHKK